jgi:hypothetical protein
MMRDAVFLAVRQAPGTTPTRWARLASMNSPLPDPEFERRARWQASMPALPDRSGRPLPSGPMSWGSAGNTGVAAARRLAAAPVSPSSRPELQESPRSRCQSRRRSCWLGDPPRRDASPIPAARAPGSEIIESNAVQLSSQRGSGAGDGGRTRDIQLGRLTLCQLSYSRPEPAHSMIAAAGQIGAARARVRIPGRPPARPVARTLRPGTGASAPRPGEARRASAGTLPPRR